MSSIALGSVVLGVVLHGLAGYRAAGWIAAVALTVYIALEYRYLASLSRRLIAAAFAAVAITVLLHPEGLRLLESSLGSAGYLAAQLAAVSLVCEAGRQSRTLKRIAGTVLSQSSSVRYLLTTLGAHLLSLVLSLPAITFLGETFRRLRDATNAEHEHASRELMTAVMRGLTTMTMWSPLSFSFAVILVSVPSVRWQEAIPWAMALSASFLLLGLGVNFAQGRSRSDMSTTTRTNPPAAIGRVRIAGVIGAIAGLMLSVMHVAAWLAIPISLAVVLLVPLFAVAWMGTRYARRSRWLAVPLTARRLARRLPTLLRGFRGEIALVSASALIGKMAGAWMNAEWLRATLMSMGLSPTALMATLLLGTTGLALLGISPMVTIAVIGAAVRDPHALGLSPIALVTTFVCSWAVGTSLTPLGPTVMLTAAAARQPSSVVAFRWNGVYALGGAMLSVVWFLVVAGRPV